MIKQNKESHSKKLSELLDKIDCQQRAVAALRGDEQDFRAEYLEGIAELRGELHKIGRNKVWLTRELV
jgi:hypothetical protein